MNDASPPGPAMFGSARAWLHLVGLAILAGIVEVFAAGSVESLPSFYYGALPVLAAVSAGVLLFDRRSVRTAIALAVAVTGIMAVLDLAGSHAAVGLGQQLTVQAVGISSDGRLVDFTAVDLFGTVAAMLRGELQWEIGTVDALNASDPRLQITAAVLKAAHLLLPFVLLGVVLGVQAWISDHVTFRRAVDERVAHMVLAWVLVPSVFFLVVTWAHDVRVAILLHDRPLVMIFLPYAPFVLVAGFGWRLAAYVLRWSGGFGGPRAES